MKQTLYKLCRHSYAMLAMSRPLFLIGTIPLYILGVAVAWNENESLDLPLLVLGMVLIWLVQLMTHYNNEYYDLETDRANTASNRISGGSQVLVKGLLPVHTARIAAILFLLLGAVLTLIVILCFDVGSLFLALVIPAFFVGWFYSAPPVKLMCRGIGEVSIIIVTCFLVPVNGYYLQTSTLTFDIVALGIPLVFIIFALSLVVELADIAADASTGKITLAVKFGLKKAMTVLFLSFCAGYICFIIAMLYILGAEVWLALLSSAPIAAMLVLIAVNRGKDQIATIEKIAMGIAMMIGYTALVFIGMLVLFS